MTASARCKASCMSSGRSRVTRSPGKVIVCGDSHTSTHGAFGAFAMGIGTSEVEHVLATQTLRQFKPKTMEIRVNGSLPAGVTAKDVVLSIIGHIGVAGATGHVIEYTGEAIRAMSMEGRMTVCNMSIEGGGRAGMIAPDATTFEYMRGRPQVPQGDDFDAAVAQWRSLASDEGAEYDSLVEIDGSALEPHVTWGTNPGMVVPVTARVPDPNSYDDAGEKESAERALQYMGLEPNTPMQDIKLDRIFIGSCTNSRIDDLRSAAEVARGRKVSDDVYAMVVPGVCPPSRSRQRMKAWTPYSKMPASTGRVAGCSMCLGMNPDIIQPGERCASTLQPQLRGTAGQGRQDAPRQPRDGSGGGNRRPLRGHPRMVEGHRRLADQSLGSVQRIRAPICRVQDVRAWSIAVRSG